MSKRSFVSLVVLLLSSSNFGFADCTESEKFIEFPGHPEPYKALARRQFSIFRRKSISTLKDKINTLEKTLADSLAKYNDLRAKIKRDELKSPLTLIELNSFDSEESKSLLYKNHIDTLREEVVEIQTKLAKTRTEADNLFTTMADTYAAYEKSVSKLQSKYARDIENSCFPGVNNYAKMISELEKLLTESFDKYSSLNEQLGSFKTESKTEIVRQSLLEKEANRLCIKAVEACSGFMKVTHLHNRYWKELDVLMKRVSTLGLFESTFISHTVAVAKGKQPPIFFHDDDKENPILFVVEEEDDQTWYKLGAFNSGKMSDIHTLGGTVIEEESPNISAEEMEINTQIKFHWAELQKYNTLLRSRGGHYVETRWKDQYFQTNRETINPGSGSRIPSDMIAISYSDWEPAQKQINKIVELNMAKSALKRNQR